MKELFTGENLALWAERALEMGAKYWYGTCFYQATPELLHRKRKQYPAHYADARTATYERHIAEGRMVCDCVGLIKGFFWTGNGTGANVYKANGCPDTSADGFYALCRTTGGISTLPETRGAVLWKKGHIGIYTGNGMAIEAQGFRQGVVRTAVTSRGWTGWGLLPEGLLRYAERIPDGDPMLRRGARGAAVSRMQEMLLRWDAGALPVWGADGVFGSETLHWVKRFQKAAGIAVDGIVGPVTWGRLKGA